MLHSRNPKVTEGFQSKGVMIGRQTLDLFTGQPKREIKAVYRLNGAPLILISKPSTNI